MTKPIHFLIIMRNNCFVPLYFCVELLMYSQVKGHLRS